MRVVFGVWGVGVSGVLRGSDRLGGCEMATSSNVDSHFTVTVTVPQHLYHTCPTLAHTPHPRHTHTHYDTMNPPFPFPPPISPATFRLALYSIPRPFDVPSLPHWQRLLPLIATSGQACVAFPTARALWLLLGAFDGPRRGLYGSRRWIGSAGLAEWVREEMVSMIIL